MHDEAHEVFYTKNQFTFRGDFALSSQTILRLPAKARALMRNVNLTLDHREVLSVGTAGHNFKIAWQELIDVISNNLIQDKLTLTVCANRKASDRDSLKEHNRPKFLKLRKVYEEVLRPIKQNLRLLKDFFLYLEGFEDHETEFEREIMGEQYRSDVRGKPLASPEERQLWWWQDSEAE